ncbi:metalloenzyme [candidate division KSB1 bacterium]|nr:metalloenzyme [candidate division KSB1 bacterium]
MMPHGLALGLDATLGVPGLPQSATGQTTLLTGINAAEAIGKHLNGFPNQKLRDIIAEHSILKQVTNIGKRAAFLNTFRPPFFDYDPFEIIRYLSVTTVVNLYAGLPFFDLDDLRNGKSIYQDISGESLRQLSFDVPIYMPEKGGEIIGRQSQEYDFSFFEYFQTDRAGHSREYSRAANELVGLERFLDTVLVTIDLKNTLVLVTSDHGNIEDLSVKGHTRNPAMTLAFGCAGETLVEKIRTIQDVTPAIMQLLIS